MQPQSTPASNTYKPKWHHFHPLTRLWVQNPFDHDVVFQVADEYNRAFRYRLPAGKVSELPGGAIATLGVKAIVDEMMQNSKTDVAHMWDEVVRTRYEEGIIMRRKDTSPEINSSTPGEINLGVKANESLPEEQPVATSEEAFPGLNSQPAPENVDEPALAPLPAQVAEGLADVIGASLPTEDAVIGSNNAHPDAEG